MTIANMESAPKAYSKFRFFGAGYLARCSVINSPMGSLSSIQAPNPHDNLDPNQASIIKNMTTPNNNINIKTPLNAGFLWLV